MDLWLPTAYPAESVEAYRRGRPEVVDLVRLAPRRVMTVDSIALSCAGLRVSVGAQNSQQDSLELSHWSGTDAGLARDLVRL